MNDREREKFIEQLNVNQHYLFKEKDTHWQWIQHFDALIKNQDSFDKQVSKSLQDHESKLVSVIELVREVKELKQQLAELQLHSHKHEAVTSEDSS